MTLSFQTARLARRLLAAAILLLMFGLALNSMVQKSPTFDEQGFLTRGLGYLRGSNRHMRVGHPLGLNALNAALLVRDERVVLPVDDPSWALTSFHRPAEIFLWELGNNVELVMFLARLPTIWLGLLLAALVGRWAGQLSHQPALGLLALGFVALDPNILAHTRLTTTDLGVTAGATLALYLLWRALRRPDWRTVALAGGGFGLLQNTKFTAGLLVPFFGLLILLGLGREWRRRGFSGRSLAHFLLTYPAAALLTLWASYGFQIGVLPANGTWPGWAGRTLPLSHHLDQLLDIFARAEMGASSFLLGQYSDTGWWYYFPVLGGLKTPVATLVLLVVGGFSAFWGWRRGLIDGERAFDLAVPLLPALGYFAIALTTTVNLGYRHLLPILPLLVVFAAANWPWERRSLRPGALALATWLAISTMLIAPDFLAFYNVLAGGPENGWRVAVDSNIDWGQDLAGLARWQAEKETGPLWLSYFGEARPDYYGIDYHGLPSFPPRLTDPAARLYNPHNPAPGLYAISASNLQGVLFQDKDLLAWFRDEEPLAKIGYSIFIYEVAATGEPANLALGGVQIDELAPDSLGGLTTNSIELSWFDPASALLWPGEADGPAYIYLPPEQTSPFSELLLPLSGIGPFWRVDPTADLGLTPPATRAAFTDPERVAELSLAGYGLAETGWRPDQPLMVTTLWRQTGAPRPVKQFLHLRDEANEIVAQWDGFGAPWQGLRTGDQLWQEHRLDLPAELPAGRYHLYTGLYDPASLVRWRVGEGDELRLQSFDFIREEDPAP